MLMKLVKWNNKDMMYVDWIVSSDPERSNYLDAEACTGQEEEVDALWLVVLHVQRSIERSSTRP